MTDVKMNRVVKSTDSICVISKVPTSAHVQSLVSSLLLQQTGASKYILLDCDYLRSTVDQFNKPVEMGTLNDFKIQEFMTTMGHKRQEKLAQIKSNVATRQETRAESWQQLLLQLSTRAKTENWNEQKIKVEYDRAIQEEKDVEEKWHQNNTSQLYQEIVVMIVGGNMIVNDVWQQFCLNSRHYGVYLIQLTAAQEKGPHRPDWLFVDPNLRPISDHLRLQTLPFDALDNWEECVVQARTTKQWIVIHNLAKNPSTTITFAPL
jgi:hypothetical protein